MRVCFHVWNVRTILSSAAWFVVCISIARAQNYVVQTTLGNVTGSVEDVIIYNNDDDQVSEKFMQFLGIPYAEPPIGDRRFAKPEAKTRWAEPHNGTYFRSSCHHGNTRTKSAFDVIETETSEDCLTLNIFSPFAISTSSSLHPVLVFIHSTPGSSRQFVGDVLATYGEVVVVVINFRQSYLGFLTIGNGTVAGNFGLWDQHMAISWVFEHITNFGGDPNMITLVGHSSGASDAIIHTLYAGNRGHIKGVVAMSGTPISIASTDSFMMTTTGNEFVAKVNCGNRSSEETLTCLRSKSLADFDTAVANSEGMEFKPVIDGDFIKVSPQEVINSDGNMYANERDGFFDVDLLIGLNNKEGGSMIQMWADLIGTNVSSFDINSAQFRQTIIPTAMNLTFNGNISNSVLDTVELQYSDLTDPTNVQKIQQNVISLSTDLVASAIVKTANVHSNKNISGTFLYQFSEELGALNPLTASWLGGANKGDDVYSLFGFSQRVLDTLTNGVNFTSSSNQRMTSRYLMTVVANFAKTGNPVRENVTSPLISSWPPYTMMTMRYVDLSHTGAVSMTYFRQPLMTFWTSVIPPLVRDTEVADDSAGDMMCPEEIGKLFPVNMLTAENIILALSIMGVCLLLSVLLICGFTIAREGTYREYNIKPVQEQRRFEL